jgi:hypothetical protein
MLYPPHYHICGVSMRIFSGAIGWKSCCCSSSNSAGGRSAESTLMIGCESIYSNRVSLRLNTAKALIWCFKLIPSDILFNTAKSSPLALPYRASHSSKWSRPCSGRRNQLFQRDIPSSWCLHGRWLMCEVHGLIVFYCLDPPHLCGENPEQSIGTTIVVFSPW